MNTLRAWLKRFVALFGKARRDRDLDAEIESHLQMHVEDNLRAGMAPQEARRQALIKLGGVEQTKESYRERRGVPFLETTLQDVRFGLRVLRKNPGVTLVAIVTLALGIGMNSTIFSVVSAILLRKPPVHDPGRVVMVSSVDPASTFAADRSAVSALDYLDWHAQSTAFSDMAAADFDDFTISGETTPQRVAGARVSPDFFRVLGVGPALGRTILQGEDEAGHDQVVILSDQLWKGRFGGAPEVVGRTVKINGNRYTVVGVMPGTFHLWNFEAQVWTPLAFSPENLRPSARSQRSLRVFARLRPGVDERHATAEMQTIAQRIAQSHRDTNEGWGASVMSLQRYTIADANATAASAFLMAAAVFVLLIGCANLASLLLARNSARQREFSIRATLGAGRSRLARQLLTECVLLSLAGGTLGVLLAFAGVRALRSQFNWNEYAVAMGKEVSVDVPVLIFTVTISLMAAILFGLVPALQISRRDASTSLKEGGRGTSGGRERHRLQRLLVVAQLALSLFLLVGAGLFVEGFLEEFRASTGLNPHNVLTASVSLRGLEYFQPQRQKQFFENVLHQLGSLPEVQSAAAASDLPYNFPGDVRFTIQGHPPVKPEERPNCGYFVVSPKFFAVTQIPLLQGREFAPSDNGSAPPVVIINDAFSKQFFADVNPIGAHVHVEGRPQNQWSEIVGVVGDVREFLGQAKPRPELFEPFLANPSGLMRLVVRTRTDPASLSDALRHAVWAADPDQAVTEIRTMDRVISDSSTGDDLMSGLMAGFALLALVMAAIGIFGVLSYLVGQRTQEMGIRLALGAEPNQVLRLVLRNGMTLVGAGAGIGFLISLALPKLIAAGFENFRFHSVWVLALAPIIVIVVGFGACYAPARRAMRVDPMVALRYE
jgi:predicted permease